LTSENHEPVFVFLKTDYAQRLVDVGQVFEQASSCFWEAASATSSLSWTVLANALGSELPRPKVLVVMVRSLSSDAMLCSILALAHSILISASSSEPEI
jgi:hypothetical protein